MNVIFNGQKVDLKKAAIKPLNPLFNPGTSKTATAPKLPGMTQQINPGNPPHPGLQLLPSKNNPQVRRWQNPNEEQPEPKQPAVQNAQEPDKSKVAQQPLNPPRFRPGDRIAFQTKQQAGTADFTHGKVGAVSDRYYGVIDDNGNRHAIPHNNVRNPHEVIQAKAQEKKAAEAENRPVKSASRSKEININVSGEGKAQHIEKGILLENGELWQRVNIGNYVDYVKLGNVNENALVNVKFGQSLGVTNSDGTSEIIHKSDVVKVGEGRDNKAVEKYMSKIDRHLIKIEKKLKTIQLDNRNLRKQIKKAASSRGISTKEQEQINRQLAREQESKATLQKELDDLTAKYALKEKVRLQDQERAAKTEKEKIEYRKQLEELNAEIDNLFKKDYDVYLRDQRYEEHERASRGKKTKYDLSGIDLDAIDFQHAMDVMHGNLTGQKGLKEYRKKETWETIKNDKGRFLQRMIRHAQKVNPHGDLLVSMKRTFGEDWINQGALDEHWRARVTVENEYVEDIHEAYGLDEAEIDEQLEVKNSMAILAALRKTGLSEEELSQLKPGTPEHTNFVDTLTNCILAEGHTKDDVIGEMLGQVQDTQEPEEPPEIEDNFYIPSPDELESLEPLDHAEMERTNYYDLLSDEEFNFISDHFYDEKGNLNMELIEEAEGITPDEMKELEPILNAVYADDYYGIIHTATADQLSLSKASAEIVADRLIKKRQVKQQDQEKLDKLKQKVESKEREFLDKYLYGKKIKKAIRYLGQLFRSQGSLFDFKSPAFTRKVTTRQPMKHQSRANMALLPSKKNPRIRRWQRTDQEHHEAKGTVDLFSELQSFGRDEKGTTKPSKPIAELRPGTATKKKVKIRDKTGVMDLFSKPKQEEHKSQIDQDLDERKKELLRKVEKLVAQKKELYSNVDIESPMSEHEKELTKEIASIYSEINNINREKREDSKVGQEPKEKETGEKVGDIVSKKMKLYNDIQGDYSWIKNMTLDEAKKEINQAITINQSRIDKLKNINHPDDLDKIDSSFWDNFKLRSQGKEPFERWLEMRIEQIETGKKKNESILAGLKKIKVIQDKKPQQEKPEPEPDKTKNEKIENAKRTILDTIDKNAHILDNVQEVRLFGSYLRSPEKANDIDIHLLLGNAFKNYPIEKIDKWARRIENVFKDTIIDGRKLDVLVDHDGYGMGIERGKGLLIYKKADPPREEPVTASGPTEAREPELPEFKNDQELNNWFLKLPEAEQEKHADFYEKEYKRLTGHAGIDEVGSAVEKENQDYIKALGYTDAQIERMTPETKTQIVDDHIQADSASILKDGSIKVMQEKEPTGGTTGGTTERPPHTLTRDIWVRTRPMKLMQARRKQILEKIHTVEKKLNDIPAHHTKKREPHEARLEDLKDHLIKVDNASTPEEYADAWGGLTSAGYPSFWTKEHFESQHKERVKEAIERGETVPGMVLRDYPDLAEKKTLKSVVMFNGKMLKTQLSLFSQPQSASRPGMVLMPSKKNPSVKRWQQTNQDQPQPKPKAAMTTEKTEPTRRLSEPTEMKVTSEMIEKNKAVKTDEEYWARRKENEKLVRTKIKDDIIKHGISHVPSRSKTTKYILHTTTKPGYLYQLTRIDIDSGQPTSDTLYKNYTQAENEALKEPDIQRAFDEGLTDVPPSFLKNKKAGNIYKQKRSIIKSDSFKKWFGDWEKDPQSASKVINKKGEPSENFNMQPVRVFHGTAKGEFTEFDLSKVGDENLYGKGFYFTEDEAVAKTYTNKDVEFKLKMPVKQAQKKLKDQLKDLQLSSTEKSHVEYLIDQLPENYYKGIEYYGLKIDDIVETNAEQKVFEVYLNIRKPYDVDQGITKDNIETCKKAINYLVDNFGCTVRRSGRKIDPDIVKQGIEKLQPGDDIFFKYKAIYDENDINEGLRAAGFDGITHMGGNIMGNKKHRVWISFRPNQIKAAENNGTFDPNENNIYKAMRKLHKKYSFQGLPISIENRKGSTRTGTDGDGHQWHTKMLYDYGYIRLTEGADGEHLDCYIGDYKNAENVFIFHQRNIDSGKYDEDKVFLGFNTAAQARAAFMKHYDRPGFYGSMTILPIEEFKQFIKKKSNKRKPVTFQPENVQAQPRAEKSQTIVFNNRKFIIDGK